MPIDLAALHARLSELYPNKPRIPLVGTRLLETQNRDHSISEFLRIELGPLSPRQFQVANEVYRSEPDLLYQVDRVDRLEGFLGL